MTLRELGQTVGGLAAALVLFGSCGGKARVADDGGGTAAGGSATGITTGGGTGGSGGSTSSCSPPPHCNWCGGEPKLDADGCVVGYVCDNGIDPCETPPCETTYNCGPGEYCGEDGLCWPCTEDGCEIGGTHPDMTCRCTSSCADGTVLSFECSTSRWGGNCDCYVDGLHVGICDIDGEPGDPCSIGLICCDWPNPDDG